MIRLIDSQSDYVEEPEQYLSYSDSSVRVVDETLPLPVQDVNVENREEFTMTLTSQGKKLTALNGCRYLGLGEINRLFLELHLMLR